MKPKYKILTSSLLTIALCLSLISGATYALFTSESTVNIAVTSGKVDVSAALTVERLYSVAADENGTVTDENGNTYSYEEQSTAWKNSGTVTVDTDGTLTFDRITAGDGADFLLNIENGSNVAALYRVKIVLAEGEDLGKELVYTIGETSYSGIKAYATPWMTLTDNTAFPLAIGLPVKSHAQDENCRVSVTVEAVQGNAVVTNERALELFPQNSYASYQNRIVGVGATENANHKYDAASTQLTVLTTEVALPAGWYENDTAEDVNAVLTVETYSAARAAEISTLTVIDGAAVVSGIDLSLIVNDRKVSEFNGKAATVTANVGTGLLNPKLYCNGEEQAITSYDPDTGVLVFNTTHFSEWFVTAEARLWSDMAAASFSDVDEAAKTVYIHSAEELALFAANVTAGNSYVGYTIRLMEDIDLCSTAKHYLWSPIGSDTAPFGGIFDGNHKTIRNMAVNDNNRNYTGFFDLINGTVKDLTIEGATVNGTAVTGCRTGILAGAADSCTVTGVTIRNATVVGEQKCAGLIGFVRGGGTVNISGSTVENVTLRASDEQKTDANGASYGGIIGYLGSRTTAVIADNTVRNITFVDILPQSFFDELTDVRYYQYVSHPIVGDVITMYSGSGSFDRDTDYVVTFTGNRVEGTTRVLIGGKDAALPVGPTAVANATGFYYDNLLTGATKPVTKLIVDGVTVENYHGGDN